MLIMAVLFMTVVFVIGVIVVDLGLWLSERRGAQSDSDFAALAGAWELLDPAGTAADAVAAASDSVDANDEQGNADLAQPIIVDDSCWNLGEDDAVTVDVNHGTKSLFASIFNIVAPAPGAHAKACAGATNAPGNVLPFQIDDDSPPCFGPDETPVLTEVCGLEFGAKSDNPRGLLDLEADPDFCSDTNGDGDIEDLIENGAPGTCLVNTADACDPENNGPWYDCVGVQSGQQAQNVLDGLQARLAGEGLCDTDGDGIDSFEESLTLVFDDDGGEPYYEPVDCDPGADGKQVSPRVITIIILDEPPEPGNTGYPIKAFAGMYLLGCTADKNKIPNPLPPDDPNKCPGDPPIGHLVVWGQLVNIIVAGSGVGPPTDATTSFSIALVE